MTLQCAAGDKLPYRWDWQLWLRPADDPYLTGDAIVDATVTAAPLGLVLEAPLVVGGSAVRVMVSGGTVGTTYTLSCTISTAAGLTAVSQQQLAVVAAPR